MTVDKNRLEDLDRTLRNITNGANVHRINNIRARLYGQYEARCKKCTNDPCKKCKAATDLIEEILEEIRKALNI